MKHKSQSTSSARFFTVLAAGACAVIGSEANAQSMVMSTDNAKVGTPSVVPAVRYVIYDLGSLAPVDNPGDDISANGVGMNEQGDVCGIAEKGIYGTGAGSGGFVWDYATGVMSEVTDSAKVSGLSDNMHTVGAWSQPWGGGFGSRPFLAAAGIPIHDPTVGIGNFGQAWAVNNSGQMAAEVDGRMYFADSDGTITQFGLPEATNGGEFPWEMNNNGVVTGVSIGNVFHQHAIRYDHATGVTTDLHTNPAWWGSVGYGINDRNDVVGYVVRDINGGDWIPATVWTAEGDVIEFALRQFGPSYAWDQAEHINMQGDVVGTADSFNWREPVIGWVSFEVRQPKFFGEFNDPKRPYQHSLRDLLSQQQRVAWTSVSCFEINDARQITGMGVHNGRTRAFLADPIPVMPGDFNLDTVISLDDVMVMANNFGKSGARPLEGDINGDRTVDMADVMMFLERALPAATSGS